VLSMSARVCRPQGSDAVKYTLPGLHNREVHWTSALPTALVVTLVYVGVVVLFLLIVPAWFAVGRIPRSLAPIHASMWLTYQGGASQIRWAFAVVGVLLVLFLWVRFRTSAAANMPLALVGHLGAAGLVLLLQWVIVLALRAVPRYALIQVFP